MSHSNSADGRQPRVLQSPRRRRSGPVDRGLDRDPKRLVGKDLQGSSLRNTYRLLVLAIKAGSTGEYHFMPEANHVLQEGDVLVVLGREMDLARFSALE